MSTGILASGFIEQFPVRTAFTKEPQAMDEHVKSALGRGLPHLAFAPWRDDPLAVAGAGPSLDETYLAMTRPIAAVNGSLGWLCAHDVVPEMCAVMDPRPHLAEVVEAVKGVTYYIAASCHPSLFDKLVKAGCDIVLWLPGGHGDIDKYVGPGDLIVPGGTTIGLRWIDLGCLLGFHVFDLHGMDSSFRYDADHKLRTHSHPDRADDAGDHVTILSGYPTGRNFIEQIRDYFARRPVWEKAGLTVRVHGSGLLQHYIAHTPA